MFEKIWKSFIERQYENLFWDKIQNTNEIIESLREQVKELKRVMSIETLNEPEMKGKITIYELNTLLKPHCTDLHLSDRIYSLTNVTQAKKYSNETKVYTKEWISEQHDCDEFSSALNGYWNRGLKQFAFGIAWSKSHAFNIFVDDKKQIYIVEPQSNKFTKIEDMKKNKRYYPLTLILI